MAAADVKLLFGRRLRELRKLRGWSQEDFAQHVGLDRSYMGGVERGERNVSLENIARIAAGLEVSLPALFEFEAAQDANTSGSPAEGVAGGDRT